MDRIIKGSEAVSEVSEQPESTSSTPAKRGGFGKKSPEVVALEPLKLTRVKVTIEGDTPMIQHKFSEKGGLQAMREKQWQIGDLTKGKKRDAKDPIALFVASMHARGPVKVKGTKEDFLKGKPVTATGQFTMPFAYIKGAMETAALDAKGITKAQVRRAIRIVEDYIPLKVKTAYMREDLVRLNDMNRTADIRYRGEFPTWEATFTVEFNQAVLTTTTVVNLLNLAGFSSGLGEWRPERGGEFGRFHVKSV